MKKYLIYSVKNHSNTNTYQVFGDIENLLRNIRIFYLKTFFEGSSLEIYEKFCDMIITIDTLRDIGIECKLNYDFVDHTHQFILEISENDYILFKTIQKNHSTAIGNI